jgi:hypothetical protein
MVPCGGFSVMARRNPIPKEFEMGNFLLIFEMFLKFFQDLMENKEEKELLGSLRRKGTHEFFAMSAFLRQETKLKGWRFRRQRRETWNDYLAMEDEHLVAMVSEAVEMRVEAMAGDVDPDEQPH